MHACRQAHIDFFINSLPQGLDTLIGDRGIKLSGGQRQRVALARTLLRKPQLLILDEATSALDAESEHAIQQSINELKGKLTLLVISHRLSTVKMANRIVVMDNGAIIQEGTWDKLSQDEGLFQRFKGLQIVG
jgi:ABC-type bacteriocin/lantibiotic exporters, contain an N-terminal double-glycine peptidase domain